MLRQGRDWLWERVVAWLTRERVSHTTPLCDFERLSHEVRPADVILVEGRSHVSDVIKAITQSPWSHSMLCIGRLHDIESPGLREKVRNYYDGPPDRHMVIEALMGCGTVISPLDDYRHDHLRICRPRDLSPTDAQRVIAAALAQLGRDYDFRQLLDLARFLFPYGLLPGRWRSTLFQRNAGAPTRTVCSTMMAEAFLAVRFPIRPMIRHLEDGRARFYSRNPRLFTPRDFDYSPYFDIIKYPFWGSENAVPYRRLAWAGDGLYHNDDALLSKGEELAATAKD